MTGITPIRREVVVDADPAAAFEVFTAGIGRWWPLADLSVHGAGATVGFVDGRIVERGAGGEEAVWGTVERWDPPGVVSFTWHPGRTPDSAGLVEVTFVEHGDGSLVTLVHSGWEQFDDPAAARAEYESGWPGVLGLYADEVGRGAGDAETWVALLHRPGPSAPTTGSVFDDPRFAEHVAFLGRLQAAGHLVAAGPFGDAEAEGMAILRLPGADGLATAVRLAEDDLSVTGGLFTVTVRPWQVVLKA